MTFGGRVRTRTTVLTALGAALLALLVLGLHELRAAVREERSPTVKEQVDRSAAGIADGRAAAVRDTDAVFGAFEAAGTGAVAALGAAVADDCGYRDLGIGATEPRGVRQLECLRETTRYYVVPGDRVAASAAVLRALHASGWLDVPTSSTGLSGGVCVPEVPVRVELPDHTVQTSTPGCTAVLRDASRPALAAAFTERDADVLFGNERPWFAGDYVAAEHHGADLKGVEALRGSGVDCVVALRVSRAYFTAD
ncbi:hypothetical protein [Yinghuangia seranimata]|uniref:hypothetical protein n=1 Tax=Yinghuangia seranimata TaxID=408067 RepID=UPI00248AF713|nr:hypothetical protein [Yinghuangia seranimata]MDI2131524.1 hypothetical protein [Yinghuangia seranimata]